ncbi:DarT ssDNA thymidine ADP-ribosyltransferase family protein [Butyrivibrio sp. AC2005]|uniref:DarT ssDNA thymidine ADP-ribosyltransferase family protein n=1 Tax=Butyrivibrio sp. AC2005 TaxID=1280672 RepID=UPI000403EA3D|nr:DarT ssDNA thymidine ADP-ribosyltransferase family protein [Butyrivibrio sp. AC2005]
MKYKDILSEQAKKLNMAYRYWPYYLYHFSDIHNIVSILEEGAILSRNATKHRGMMASDNSSEIVIRKTKEEAYDYARLYFRPLTPTQYHNEGYKPAEVRDIEINASCPVPIFLVMDADAILSMENTFFVEQGIAGTGHAKKTGIEEFQNLDFEQIYDNRIYSGDKWKTAKKYRMSEVIRENGFPIDNVLKAIICRSKAERNTLLYLLKEKSDRLYEKYKSMIHVRADFECFYYNGLYVEDVHIRNNILDIDFNDPAIRGYHVAKVDMKIKLLFCDFEGNVTNEQEYHRVVDYDSSVGFQIPIDDPILSDSVRITILFDGIEIFKDVLYISEDVMI